jgi:hypothetical protein
VGTVAGSFYQIIVDRQPAALSAAMLHAAALYAACVACSAAGAWLAAWLAVTWRARLGAELHRRFAAGVAFAQLPSDVDNPDQRMTADAAALCDALGAAARLAAGAPFRAAFYSALAARYVGWRGVGAVYAFFWAAAAAQRLVAAPLARRLFRQERLEGDLRHAHLRLRQYSDEVAAYRGAPAERAALDAALAAALRGQRGLVGWRAAAAGAARATDYAGALLNYALVAAAAAAGAAGAGASGGEGSGGRDAQFVSNASFMTLALIYSFTEVLDLAEAAAGMAALAARVGGLLEALPAPPPEQGDAAGGGEAAGGGGGRELRPSGAPPPAAEFGRCPKTHHQPQSETRKWPPKQLISLALAPLPNSRRGLQAWRRPCARPPRCASSAAPPSWRCPSTPPAPPCAATSPPSSPARRPRAACSPA